MGLCFPMVRQHLAGSGVTLKLDEVATLAGLNLIHRLPVNLVLNLQRTIFCLHYPTQLGYDSRMSRDVRAGPQHFLFGKKNYFIASFFFSD